jgi:hypothetical protein
MPSIAIADDDDDSRLRIVSSRPARMSVPACSSLSASRPEPRPSLYMKRPARMLDGRSGSGGVATRSRKPSGAVALCSDGRLPRRPARQLPTAGCPPPIRSRDRTRTTSWLVRRGERRPLLQRPCTTMTAKSSSARNCRLSPVRPHPSASKSSKPRPKALWVVLVRRRRPGRRPTPRPPPKLDGVATFGSIIPFRPPKLTDTVNHWPDGHATRSEPASTPCSRSCQRSSASNSVGQRTLGAAVCLNLLSRIQEHLLPHPRGLTGLPKYAVG